MGDITIREFLHRWDAGDFDASFRSMCDAGWYDWFCTDQSLFGRLEKMVPAIRRIAKSSKVNQDTMNVFFKNNCPCWINETYDDFRICDIQTGEILYTVLPRYPLIKTDAAKLLKAHPDLKATKEDTVYVSEVWDFVADEHTLAAIFMDNVAKGKPINHEECVVLGPRKEMYGYFGV